MVSSTSFSIILKIHIRLELLHTQHDIKYEKIYFYNNTLTFSKANICQPELHEL
jgi:hypothetical protein